MRDYVAKPENLYKNNKKGTFKRTFKRVPRCHVGHLLVGHVSLQMSWTKSTMFHIYVTDQKESLTSLYFEVPRGGQHRPKSGTKCMPKVVSFLGMQKHAKKSCQKLVVVAVRRRGPQWMRSGAGNFLFFSLPSPQRFPLHQP